MMILGLEFTPSKFTTTIFYYAPILHHVSIAGARSGFAATPVGLLEGGHRGGPLGYENVC